MEEEPYDGYWDIPKRVHQMSKGWSDSVIPQLWPQVDDPLYDKLLWWCRDKRNDFPFKQIRKSDGLWFTAETCCACVISYDERNELERTNKEIPECRYPSAFRLHPDYCYELLTKEKMNVNHHWATFCIWHAKEYLELLLNRSYKEVPLSKVTIN